MAEKKEKADENTAKSKVKTKNNLTYAKVLEGRAQRGSKTHQKIFALKKAQEKEMKGE